MFDESVFVSDSSGVLHAELDVLGNDSGSEQSALHIIAISPADVGKVSR